MLKTYEIASVEDLTNVAKDLLNHSGPTIWAFYGEMGAGKTTFIQRICKALKVNQTISSPTFNLINEYENESGDLIYHFDFYRLDSIEEALGIGTMEYFDSGELCFLEWPEKVETLLPEIRRNIYIEIVNNTKRIIKVEDHV